MGEGKSNRNRHPVDLRWAAIGLALLVFSLWLFNAWQNRQASSVERDSGHGNPSVYLKLPPVSVGHDHVGADDDRSESAASTAPISAVSLPAVAPGTQPAPQSSHAAIGLTALPAPTRPQAATTSSEHPVGEHSPNRVSATLPGTTCRDPGWYAQQGAFGRIGQAEALSERLTQAHFSVCIGNLSNDKLYRVLVGPLPDRQAATAVAASIHKDKLAHDMGYPQYWSMPR